MSAPTVPRLRSLALGWLLSFGAFGLFAALVATQSLSGGMITPREALLFAARDWLPWAVMAPPLFLVVEAMPPEGSGRRRAPIAYALCGVAALAVAVAWAGFVMPPGGGPRHEQTAEHEEPPLAAPGRPGPPRGEPRPPPIMPLLPGGPICLAIFGLALARHFNRRAKEREIKAAALREDMARASLRALRMQLHPHFLFNSLNAIASLIHDAPDKADEMTVALADFLRRTLEAPDEHEVALRRELEFTDLYLRIEQVRFGDRLRIARDIADDTRAALVPAFLLQPLVENAVRHGLAPLSRPTAVTLSARREGARLVLRVADDGAGAPAGTPPREGIGLSNTRARLTQLYGAEATLNLRHDPGFSVEITLPFRSIP